MLKTTILSLSILSLIVSAIWMYQTNFDYEPITVSIMGVVGILYFFLKPEKDAKNPKSNEKIVKSTNNSNNSYSPKSENNNNLNVNVNVGSQEKPSEIENSISQEGTVRDLEIDAKKPKTHILFIDDDKNFNVVKILKNSGWKNTKSVVDLKSLDTNYVKNADIIFVDINGVGINLDLPNEGLDLALMLKQKYKQKKVVIYSANKKNNIFHKAWEVCDFKLEKNALPYQFQSLVEKYSLET